MTAEQIPVDVVRLSPDVLAGSVLDDQVAELFQRLVRAGAALGWVQPPPTGQVAVLLRHVAAGISRGDACCAAAMRGEQLVGLGYWRRYTRPTHRPHADVEKIAVDPADQRQGIGRRAHRRRPRVGGRSANPRSAR